MSQLSLKLPIEEQFLPVATSFMENGTLSFGFAAPEAMALTLATEELFMYLTHIGHSEADMEIICSKGSCFARADINFPIGPIDLQAFNVTATISYDSEDDLDRLGLLMAARSVDHFEITWPDNRVIRLTLIKEKKYPRTEAVSPLSVKPLTEFSIRPPEPAEAKLFAELATQWYPAQDSPSFMRYPGKVADMIAGGDLAAALALDSRGNIGGGIAWRWVASNSVAFFGPYVFGQPEAPVMGRELVDALIGALARSACVNLISRFATPWAPAHYFQKLGTIRIGEDEGGREQTALFMHLREDHGSRVWIHPDLKDFLSTEYTRLSLPREIAQVADAGEEHGKHTVLSSEFDRDTRSVHLRPVLFGDDAQKVIEDHLGLFDREGARSVLFDLDLGVSWHAHFAPPLLKSGFVPCLIMPHGGEGDLLVLQRAEGSRKC